MIDQIQVVGKLQEVQEAFNKLVEETRSAARQGRAIDMVEQEIWQGLLRVGQKLLGSVFQQLGDGDVGAEIERESQKPLKRSTKPQRRRYRSIFGSFELSRYTYAEHAKRRADRIPFDEQLALPAGDYSLLLEKWLAAAACETSFEQAVALLAQMLEDKIPVDSAERICRRQAEPVEDFINCLPTPPADEEGQVLVYSVDRKGVPLRRPDPDAAPVFSPQDQTGPKPGTKKMATVGTVYSVDRYFRSPEEVVEALFRHRRRSAKKVDRKRPRPQHRRTRAMLPVPTGDEECPYIEPTAAICDWMSEQVEVRKTATEEIALLCDGEEALWATAEWSRDPSTPVTEILDLMHVLPRIWTCGKHLHGNQTLERFVRYRLKLILQGNAASVVRGIRRMATTRILSREAKREIRNACNYLQQQLPRMRYDEYLSRGLPIASGVIEGACRHLVKDRMERSGMRWTLLGAQAILDLRSVRASDLTSEYWLHYRSQSLQKRYGATRTNYAEALGLAA